MESFVSHLLHFALWSFFIIFAFAIIGFVAVMRWIVGLFRKTESAVEGEVHDVQRAIRRE